MNGKNMVLGVLIFTIIGVGIAWFILKDIEPQEIDTNDNNNETTLHGIEDVPSIL